MALRFYLPDRNYVDYLQTCERKERGFSHVPNMNYEDRNEKFVCGVVLEINGFDYYVPISSYTKKQKDNILIEIPKDNIHPVKGSLRFNYMFPIPKNKVRYFDFSEVKDIKRQKLLYKEYDFCKKNEGLIRNRAKQTYSKVIHKVSDNIVKNSCDFQLLEKAVKDYLHC